MEMPVFGLKKITLNFIVVSTAMISLFIPSATHAATTPTAVPAVTGVSSIYDPKIGRLAMNASASPTRVRDEQIRFE